MQSIFCFDRDGKSVSPIELFEKNPDHFFQIKNYGTAVFETWRTYFETEIFALPEHVNRWFSSAKILKIDLPFSKKIIADSCRSTAKFAKIPGSNLRGNLFGTENFFWISVKKLDSPAENFYREGVEIVDEVFERQFSQAKTPSPAYNFFEKSRVPEIFETIFFDTKNMLREGNISNVFAVFDGKIHTPPAKNVLPGITREKVLELAPVITREITRDELRDADEIFLTNTSREIVPVRKWNDWKNDNFVIATMIREKFRKKHVSSSKK